MWEEIESGHLLATLSYYRCDECGAFHVGNWHYTPETLETDVRKRTSDSVTSLPITK